MNKIALILFVFYSLSSHSQSLTNKNLHNFKSLVSLMRYSKNKQYDVLITNNLYNDSVNYKISKYKVFRSYKLNKYSIKLINKIYLNHQNYYSTTFISSCVSYPDYIIRIRHKNTVTLIAFSNSCQILSVTDHKLKRFYSLNIKAEVIFLYSTSAERVFQEYSTRTIDKEIN